MHAKCKTIRKIQSIKQLSHEIQPYEHCMVNSNFLSIVVCFETLVRVSMHGICPQHYGRSIGGDSRLKRGSGPSLTIKTITKPHVMCTSKWQCITQAPAIHDHHFEHEPSIRESRITIRENNKWKCKFMHTRIFGHESYRSPTIDWNVHGVTHRRIGQVELMRIFLWIVIAKPWSHDVKGVGAWFFDVDISDEEYMRPRRRSQWSATKEYCKRVLGVL